MVKLEQLKSAIVVEGESCGDEEDKNQTLEGDLSEALDLLDQCLHFIEEIRVRRGRITGIPAEMQDLLTDLEEFMDQWQGYGDEQH